MIKDFSRPPKASGLDLSGLHLTLALRSIQAEGDTAPLIEFLRNGGNVGPELKLLLADLLEGKVKGHPKQRPRYRWFSRSALKAHISEFAHLAMGERIYVDGDWDEAYDAVVRDLAEFGIPSPRSRREATDAAKRVLCDRLKATPSQLNEYLSVRKARQKSW